MFLVSLIIFGIKVSSNKASVPIKNIYMISVEINGFILYFFKLIIIGLIIQAKTYPKNNGLIKLSIVKQNPVILHIFIISKIKIIFIKVINVFLFASVFILLVFTK